MGTLSKLRRLVLRDNVSVREAARRLNISRNTARRYLAQPEDAAQAIVRKVVQRGATVGQTLPNEAGGQ